MKPPRSLFIRLLEVCFAGRLAARERLPYLWMQERGRLGEILTLSDTGSRFPEKMNSA